ncbi:MAG: hypothetical protein HC888_01430 [Candidatus Competibacteraceae bacterium]|nr:hypothetical protein [Candidatus Competibacteraceae bacterium]
MPAELIKYGFSGGVFSRALQGRPDLEKYDLGLAVSENFFIDYRGGATSRAGTQFCEQAGATSLPAIRFFSFRFNRLLSNNYLLVFTPGKLRFVQDGAYVLEATKAISGIVTNTVTSAAHGYAVGDLVQISARTYVIGAVTTDTFTTLDFEGAAENPSGTEVQRVYTIDTPYTADMLPGLQFRQRRDMVRITTLDYGPMDLTRVDHTDWDLAVFASGGAAVASPSAGFAATASGGGAASVNWTVTSVDQEGKESYLTTIQTAASIVDYTNTAGSIKFAWTPVAGARYYNIYRSLVFPAAGQNSVGQQLGFIGRAYGASFTDTNVTPNFGISPQTRYNPFDVGQVAYIEITNPGSGYTSNPTVSVSGGGGSGFVGLPIRSSSNTIEGVLVLNPGSGYASPTVSFTGGGGTSAAGTVHLNEATGSIRPSPSSTVSALGSWGP